jgi:phosphate transport system protein
MFERLFSWWKEDVLLKKALEETTLALEKTLMMFSFAMDVLLEGTDGEKKIYEMDKVINALQVDIRKKVFEHLTINPEQDVTASLVLTTVVVDVERIGDFAKNIVELRQMCAGRLDHPKYLPEVIEIREKLESSIRSTGEAFRDPDTEKARKMTDEYTLIARKCDETLDELASKEDLNVREAVVYGLLFRYLKRVSAHGRNIASSIVNPFHRLGFKPE